MWNGSLGGGRMAQVCREEAIQRSQHKQRDKLDDRLLGRDEEVEGLLTAE